MFRNIFLFCLATFLVPSAFARSFIQDTDLISLHYDHAPDRDDGHATVAALMVTSSLGIHPHVVSGAYGSGNKHRYVSAAEKVMQAAWPGIWLNAHANWNGTVNTTADLWINTINAGGNIHVAEGGQSDFSADVVRRIKQLTSINTASRITIVQHSEWNEEQASQADLRYVRSNTTYVKIDDGNKKNLTADLNQKNSQFVAQARESEFSTAWNAAFSYLNPNTKLDFSDTVELLHILEISKNMVATINDFGDKFFSANSNIIPDPTQATAWSDSYAVDGQCYCDSSYDHGLRSNNLATPDGEKSVPQICEDINSILGTGPISKRIYYNTVQCGHGPVNNAADESECPGIPRNVNDYTGYRCGESGPTWNLDLVYPNEPPTETPTCSIGASDEDKDGFGVENGQTCAIDTSRPTEPEKPERETPIEPETPETESSIEPDNFSYPNCSADALDSDSDGYGYENGQSCLITAAISQPEPSEVPVEPETPVVLSDPHFPDCSASVSDDNSDGYGFENGQSCVITAAISQPEAPAQSEVPVEPETTLLLSDFHFPDCSASVSDDNSDGYGFENGQSCVITAAISQPEPPAQPEVPVEPETPVVLSDPHFPDCSASVSDDNSDGYGFENGQSCLITAVISQPEPAQSEVAVEPETPLLLSNFHFPDCSVSVSDDNSDGYGFENGQSCVITAAISQPEPPAQPEIPVEPETPVVLSDPHFPDCSASVSDDNSDGYGFENGQSCVITAAISQPEPPAQPEIPVEPETPVVLSDPHFPDCSASVSDDNSDGYGFENGQSCVITTTAIPNQSGGGTLFRNCSANIFDHDNDGYGYENGQSCVVAATSPPTTVDFPDCSANAVDPDADGYGYENGQSCVIATQTSPSDGTDQNAGPLFPDCSATIVDQDADGYGYENGQSCVIATSQSAAPFFPECSPNILDQDNDGYGYENSQSCIIIRTAIPNQTGGGTFFPNCSGNVVDHDNDGYSYENGQSCVVVPKTALSSPGQSAAPLFPVCSAGIGDHDQDGYGYENGQSCTTTTGRPLAVNLQFPRCTSDVTDEDADGYGFENFQTCVMPTTGQ